MLPPKNPIRIFNIKYSDKTRRRVHELVDHVLDEAFLTNHTLCRDLENLVNSLKADNAPTALIEWFMFAYKEWERKLNEKIPLSKCAPISPANIDHLSNINDQKLNRKGIKNLDILEFGVRKGILSGLLFYTLVCSLLPTLIFKKAPPETLDTSKI